MAWRGLPPTASLLSRWRKSERLFARPQKESQMTEAMIEETETEVEEFTDTLSDEALDREENKLCMMSVCSRN